MQLLQGEIPGQVCIYKTLLTFTQPPKGDSAAASNLMGCHAQLPPQSCLVSHDTAFTTFCRWHESCCDITTRCAHALL